MAFTRSYLYPESYQLISHFGQAISHPARIAIIEQLAKDGPDSVENLRKLHPLTQPTLSQHLKILRTDQLVICQEKFPYTIYEIHKANYKKLKQTLRHYADSL